MDHSRDVTGAFLAVFGNLDHCRKAGVEFFYFVPQGSRVIGLLREAGVPVHTFRNQELSRNLLNVILYLPFLVWNGYRLSRLVRRYQCDWVHQNELFIMTGMVASFFTDVYLLTHIRVLPKVFPKLLYRTWVRLQAKYSERFVAASLVCKEAAAQEISDPSLIEVLYDFVIPKENLPPYQVLPASSALRVLFLGNYTRGKGQEIAIRAVDILRQRRPEMTVTLTVHGSDLAHPPNRKFRAELASLVSALKLEDHVNLFDRTTDIEKVIKENDLILNLSVAESFSFVVAESLSFGIPVIATRSGGPQELLENGRCGHLTGFSASEIADAILMLAEDSEVRQQYSTRGKERIKELLQARGGQDKFLRLYQPRQVKTDGVAI